MNTPNSNSKNSNQERTNEQVKERTAARIKPSSFFRNRMKLSRWTHLGRSKTNRSSKGRAWELGKNKESRARGGRLHGGYIIVAHQGRRRWRMHAEEEGVKARTRSLNRVASGVWTAAQLFRLFNSSRTRASCWRKPARLRKEINRGYGRPDSID